MLYMVYQTAEGAIMIIIVAPYSVCSAIAFALLGQYSSFIYSERVKEIVSMGMRYQSKVSQLARPITTVIYPDPNIST